MENSRRLVKNATERASKRQATERLFKAAGKGDLVEIAYALEQGADIDGEAGVNGWTPLMSASHHGQALAIKALVKAGASLELARGDNARVPLLCACAAGRFEAIEALLEAGADLERKDSQGGNGALALASEARSSKSVQSLLKAGPDLNARNSRGETPLILAVRAGEPVSARLLILAGANADLRSLNELSAWTWAVGDPTMEKELSQALEEREALRQAELIAQEISDQSRAHRPKLRM